ncbi:MAG TPA: DUF2232 domain-containing protein [candidate division Zixibacteria bacterium]|nr:DUF2232 domain-containing protein [candidate division Zixibacteria bacterium]MDD4916630.1 DUF2232 domain-containing protein [candidate division Zixibacteria bacterium]MDM7974143.1 DUF2232 domain-containing protein [candidate division Zixibacteria bacterium]HOD67576.1 DUF2232 domain-containing protein [candidate division Zixibacteria bacterium]HOZ08021.1 DUF2232 domain-containing protein [candidate division Zixibacteria bacterium]
MDAAHTRGTTATVAAALLFYAALLYAGMADHGRPLAVLAAAPVMYFTAMYLYYGLTRLAFARRQWALWGSAVAAVAVSYLLLGGSHLWMLVFGWGMLLVTAVLTGRLTSGGYRPRTVYIAAVLSLVAFGSALYLPLWLDLVRAMPKSIETVVDAARERLAAAGESDVQVEQLTEAFRRLATVVLRLAPAAMLLSAVVQFSVGYLLFVKWVDRCQAGRPQYEPFHFWRMPYGFVPVTAAAAAVRLLGGAAVQLAADNALAFLAVFYCLTGLSFVEFYLRRVQFTRFMKVLFYVFLALLPLVYPVVGVIAFGAIALVGFADSFADWRRLRLREFE